MNDPGQNTNAEQAPETARGLDAEIAAHKIDTLVRSANIHAMQGRLSDAITACQECLALEPDNPDVRELLGDILAKQGKRQAAMAEYRAVFEAHPNRIAAERKMAQLSLMVGEQMRVLERQRQLVEDPSKREHAPDRTRIALFSSLVLPGLGQLYLGAYFKGAALLVTALALLYYVINKMLLEPLSALAEGMTGSRGGMGGAFGHIVGYSGVTKVLLIVVSFLILGAYAYSIIDAMRTARAEQERSDAELGI